MTLEEIQAADRKRNLECPTCRDQLIVKDYEYDTLRILREKAILKRYAKTLEVVKLANNGEVFFSKDQREILQAFNLQDFPNLKYIFIITNGLLFNQKTYDQLRPGTEFIKKVPSRLMLEPFLKLPQIIADQEVSAMLNEKEFT